jgi:hypothetical protein
MLKNKKTQIIIGVILVILLLGGGYFLFLNKSSTRPQTDQSQSVNTGPLNLSADEIGLKLTATPDKKKIQFSIGKLAGIKAVSYELTYEADSTQQEISEGGDSKIQRGVTGEAKFNKGDSSYESPWLDLGSCSKNVCRYDAGVSSVNIILKITKDDDKIYQTQQKLDL